MESAHEFSQRKRLEAINHAILESALDCIITMDSAGRVLEFNPAAEKTFGYTRAQAVGQELAELIIPPPLRERHRKGLRHFLETGEGPVLGRRIEIAGLRSDGAEILVELAITAFRIDGVPLFTAYLRDITERVRTERRRATQYAVASLLASSMSLEEAGTRIIEAIARSGDWVFGSLWLKDESKKFLRCHHTWHGAAGDLETFASSTRALIFAENEGLPGRVLASKEPTWISDFSLEEKFARRHAAKVAGLRGSFCFPLMAELEVKGVIELFSANEAEPDDDLLQLVDSLGSQIGLFIRRREIDQELQQQKDAAESANAAKDRFLASLSHELRTPLNPILIWAGAMSEQTDLPTEIQAGVKMIRRNIALEARLIDDLLDLTRITRGKLFLRPSEIDAHEALQSALEISQTNAGAQSAEVSLQLDATHFHLWADAPRLQQAFWNVLQNAHKFSQKSGEITVRTSNPTPERFRVEITDNGSGIELEHLEKIFEAFHQGSEKRDGLGLGLAITKAIVELHGGTIEARSEGPGRGAKFTIQLPIPSTAAS